MRPFEVKTHDVHIDAEYTEWIQELKRRYRAAKTKAAVKVNSEQLLFNWMLGRDLVIRRAEEKWGKGVVEQVSLDLKAEFPNTKGFGVTNLWYMKRWYLFYSQNLKNDGSGKLQQLVEEIEDDSKLHQIGIAVSEEQQGYTVAGEKLQQAVEELAFPVVFSYVPWGHHILILTKVKSVDEALFYIKCTIDRNLSRNALDDYIRNDFYHNSGTALTNFDERLPEPQGKLAQELLKGNYDLGFVTLFEGYDETELEDAIEQRMTRFLLELGEGWAFVGRQKEIVVSGKTKKIDLLFYHIYLRCYVVIELKVKPFLPEFAGKLNFYVNAVDDLIRRDSDNPTVGLLICRDMDTTEVQYAFRGITTPLGVATYDNVKIKEIQEKLPSPDQIKTVIEQAEAEYYENQKKKK